MDGEKRNLSKTLTSFGTVDPFDGKRPFSIEEREERDKKKSSVCKTLRKAKMIRKHKSVDKQRDP